MAGHFLALYPPPDPSHELVFLSPSIESTCKEVSHVLTKRFGTGVSHLYLAYVVPQRDLGVLCDTYGVVFITTGTVVTMLCCA